MSTSACCASAPTPAASTTSSTTTATSPTCAGLATDGYELVILQHVLEQIIDYRAALDELARVLEPGGRALLEIPGHTQSRTEIKPGDRYGNRWTFGDDLVEDLRRRFGGVRRHKAALGQYRGSFYVCVGA